MVANFNAQEKSEDVFQNAWEQVSQMLKKDYGDAVYISWIKHLELESIKGSEATLTAPTRFIREWIANNYIDRIRFHLSHKVPQVKTINLLIRKSGAKPKAVINEDIVKLQQASGLKKETSDNTTNLFDLENSSELGSPLDRRFTFENYIVGATNELAYASAKSIAEGKNILNGNNPLFLHGGVGLGKTHLMHAIAWYIKKHQPERNVVYLSAEKFMYQFVKALKSNSMMFFKEKFRAVDVLMIDDVQFICGKQSTQEEFFHTLNTLLDLNKQIVISSNKSPSDLEGMDERIRSRLGWGLVADISTTTFDLRFGILKSKVKQIPSAKIPDEVLNFLSIKINSNVRELEGALNKVIAHSTLMNKDITLVEAQTILADLLRANDKVITIVDIQKSVAEYFGLKVHDLSSARRARCVARPRQIAMYLCKQLTQRSLSEIGRKFGGKDHTTVMHAIKKVDQLCEEDNEFKDDVEMLVKTIRQT